MTEVPNLKGMYAHSHVGMFKCITCWHVQIHRMLACSNTSHVGIFKYITCWHVQIMGRIMGKYYCTLLKSNNNSSSLFIVNNIIPIDTIDRSIVITKIIIIIMVETPRPLRNMASKIVVSSMPILYAMDELRLSLRSLTLPLRGIRFTGGCTNEYNSS